MSSPQWQSQVVPARLSFLAIYNPSLGPTDDTFADQLVYYHSRATYDARLATRKNARNDAAGGDSSRKEENERLRQIGLAQGMVDFARSFSDEQPVDSIDTEKSRIVLHELEKEWWILASVDLTRLPMLSHSSSDVSKMSAEKTTPKPAIEYSAREVSPPALLLAQLIQAHHIFTLHHGPSLTELFVKLPRDKFCNTLDRYWTRFARTWDVLLHGNPASDIFSGLKLSSGGELGMGVGEEEWGSGERAVLEEMTRSTKGLVDLVVSRFGEPAPPKDEALLHEEETLPWLGSGNYPLATDGVVFGGINALARPSLRNVSLWTQHIYTYGEYAYGVRDNPLRERRRRRKHNLIMPTDSEPEPEPEPEPGANGRKHSHTSVQDHAYKGRSANLKPKSCSDSPSDNDSATRETNNDIKQAGYHPGIPPPIVSAAQQSLEKATKITDTQQLKHREEGQDNGTTWGVPDQYMKYLTFGLSTLAKPSPQNRPDPSRQTSSSSSKTLKAQHLAATRLKKQEELAESDDDKSMAQMEPTPDGQTLKDKIIGQKHQEERGHFVVGLKGDLDVVSEDPDAIVSDLDDDSGGPRNVLRTVQVELIPGEGEERTDLQRKLDDAGLESAKNDPLNFKRLRVLVYIRRPFIYCFLFENRTPTLSVAKFYKDLHRTLAPIHKPLLESTSVTRISQRIEESQAQASTSTSDTASVTSGSKSKAAEPKPIYDLIWDPALLTIHTSIPNIPEPGTPAAEGILPSRKDAHLPHSPDWTRIEALNVHSQILNTVVGTQRNAHEYERTSKTSRGWWVVWMKLPPSKVRDTAVDEVAESKQQSAKEPGTEDAGEDEEASGAASEAIESDGSDETVQPSISMSSKWLASTATTQREQRPTNRIAFLVRKASETTAPAKSNPTSRAASSMWQALSLRPNAAMDEATGGVGAGWGPAALASGIGIDARKYVESLLQLDR